MIHNGELKDFKSLIIDINEYIEKNSSKLIVGGFLKVFLFSLIRLLQVSYVIINQSKYLLEIQYTKQKLFAEFNLKKGKLLELSKSIAVLKKNTNNDTVRMDHKVLSAKEIVMYLDIVFLENGDCLAIEILKDDSIYYIPPPIDQADLPEYFNKVFIVL
jgi:hypothetical protein